MTTVRVPWWEAVGRTHRDGWLIHCVSASDGEVRLYRQDSQSSDWSGDLPDATVEVLAEDDER